MTSYTVHLYREMRLVFPGIDATTPEEAARIASANETAAAERVEDCEGLTYCALVDRDGDDGHAESQTVFLRADGGEIEPAPTDVTNRTRAAWAEACVRVFTQHTGCDREDALGDLLCDLMHWSFQHSFDMAAALDRALGHFEAELLEEGQVPPHPIASLAEIGRLRPAATPLLDALDSLLSHVEEDVPPENVTRHFRDALDDARAAVANAKGGAQ